MTKLVVLVWMHKKIINPRVTEELALFMKSTVKTLRANYPIIKMNGSTPKTKEGFLKMVRLAI